MRLSLILALSALPSLALADGAGPLSGEFCFARAPAAERRADGPHLLIGPAPADVPAAEGAVPVSLLLLPEPGRFLSALAEWREREGRLDCLMEGDAGAFSVTAAGPRVVVWPGDEGLVFEDGAGFVTAWEGGGRAVTLAACAPSGLGAFGQS